MTSSILSLRKVLNTALPEPSVMASHNDKMEDVIFNGTKNRKPIGMADVSLTIENAKGIHPTQGTRKITVTRRVYRSGESKYLLKFNQTPLQAERH